MCGHLQRVRQDRKQEEKGAEAGLPGSVAEERLGKVPGEVVGSELRQGRHARPRLFSRSPWGERRRWGGHGEGPGPRAT